MIMNARIDALGSEPTRVGQDECPREGGSRQQCAVAPQDCNDPIDDHIGQLLSVMLIERSDIVNGLFDCHGLAS
jgi:hypothetical protein